MEKQKENSGSRTFTRKDGHKSPILMKKKGEKDEGFFKRMEMYGWGLDDIKAGHSKPDSNEYHTGSLTDCTRCKSKAPSTEQVVKQVKTEEKGLSPEVKSNDEKVKANEVLNADGSSKTNNFAKDIPMPPTKAEIKSIKDESTDVKPTAVKGVNLEETKTK